MLITLAVIGLLSVIAIPHYSQYRSRAYDQTAHLALRATAVAEEAHYAETGEYVACDQGSCPSLLPNLPQYTEGIEILITVDPGGYIGTARHAKGSGAIYSWMG